MEAPVQPPAPTEVALSISVDLEQGRVVLDFSVPIPSQPEPAKVRLFYDPGEAASLAQRIVAAALEVRAKCGAKSGGVVLPPGASLAPCVCGVPPGLPHRAGCPGGAR